MRRCLILAALFLGAFPACGGAPKHDGYKSAQLRPWQKPSVLELELDEEEDEPIYEAESDGTVDYPGRKRARWFAVDLPQNGALSVNLNVQSFEDDDGQEREIDVAFEVLDSRYKVIETADRESDDAGDMRKKREFNSLPQGRYYVHVYAQNRTDRADFTLRLSFTLRTAAYKSDFPARVAYIGVLPQVPAFDDSPVVAKRPPVKRPRGTKPPPPQPKSPSLSGRIAGIKSRPSGTTITINRGSRDGVSKGWVGNVVSKEGKRVPNGAFVVSDVSETQSYATVRASQDTVTNAKYVRLRAP